MACPCMCLRWLFPSLTHFLTPLPPNTCYNPYVTFCIRLSPRDDRLTTNNSPSAVARTSTHPHPDKPEFSRNATPLWVSYLQKADKRPTTTLGRVSRFWYALHIITTPQMSDIWGTVGGT
ncbi:hypothetical protein I79_007846 [Cricetulus griseus]|uniref:Secreted protein n=1 Tax=Cricetulus griseus TaxID=10029 RepID=G3HBL2_CRIGR|nr:hypothetical protein I79_007846 [Cricetulus griseus]ERE70369.1 hypothetical protein H671_6g16530 [Cricetulus griseus]